MSLQRQAAILGVGASTFARRPQVSVLELAGAALRQALADAELERGAIDGLVVQIGSPRGADYDTVAQSFGLDVRYASQTWPHGRFTSNVLLQAAMAVQCGMATRVACLLAMKNSDIGRIGETNNPFYYEQLRENGGPHAEELQVGMVSPVAGAGLAFDLYCQRYGKDRELLAEIPLTFRRHAQLNPDAVAQAPLTLEDYRQARPIVDPLRLYDCSLVGDGAVCIIVGGAEQARQARDPVWIAGAQGVQAGRDTFLFGPRGLGFQQQDTQRLTLRQARAQQAYRMAGITPDDVDLLGVYDSFSPLPVYVLEDFGFCEAGTGLDWIQGGRIALGGALPTNTNGGQLSHAQVNGWGQVRELVLQLRHQAGARQVAGCRVALWATAAGDAVVLQRD